MSMTALNYRREAEAILARIGYRMPAPVAECLERMRSATSDSERGAALDDLDQILGDYPQLNGTRFRQHNGSAPGPVTGTDRTCLYTIEECCLQMLTNSAMGTDEYAHQYWRTAKSYLAAGLRPMVESRI